MRGRMAALQRLAALVLVLGAGSGCAARYKLSDVDLEEAQQTNSLGDLRVYVSHRTLSVYDEPAMRTVVVSREIRQRSRAERRKNILSRNTSGAIVGEDLLNGQRILWVTFDSQCATPECAYGFVQVEDARYVLTHVPEREGYAPARVHRSLVMKRHRMKPGHIRALSDANRVYTLTRRNRVPVVFLEVKRANQDRVEERSERESGV